MSTAEQILVIILSSFLGIFTILAIVATSLIIKFMHKLNELAQSAKNMTEHVEEAAAAFQNVAGPVTFTRALSKIIKSIKNSRRD